MRLIDADKLKEELGANGLGYQYYMLDNAPTVEAIPIEHLKKQVEIYYDLGLDSIAKELKYIIWEWEKENEAN